MSTSPTRHVYGPVPSRRLGRSLGVDLVPFKTCSYDCIYCQLGRTTDKTTELKEYVPVDAVLDELAEKLRNNAAPDYIGLAGSGEPTLHARMGELIAGIKSMTNVPVAVLTSGSMLWKPEVRAGLAEADLVLPSMDAGDQRHFERVNRPHPDISFDRMAEGLIAFAESYRGTLWLEVFVLAGLTDRPKHMSKIAGLAKRIHPARVQLNTVSRPPAEQDALVASTEMMETLRPLFPGLCEIIAEARRGKHDAPAAFSDVAEEVLSLLDRRPCTVEGIAAGLALPPSEVVKHIDVLVDLGTVRPTRRDHDVFYERVRGKEKA